MWEAMRYPAIGSWCSQFMVGRSLALHQFVSLSVHVTQTLSVVAQLQGGIIGALLVDYEYAVCIQHFDVDYKLRHGATMAA